MQAVRGLHSYITRTAAARESIDLGQTRIHRTNRRLSRPRLLCDFSPVVEWVLSAYDAHLVKSGQISHLSLLYGGDLQLYRQRIVAFVRALRHLGVSPVFFMEGAPGGDLEYFEVQLPDLCDRHEEQLEQNATVYRVCEGTGDLLQVRWRLSRDAVDEITKCLQSEGVAVRHCTRGTVEEVVEYQRRHRNVLGVLSSNTDFAIAAGSKLFPLALFDVNDNLGIESPSISPQPDSLVCEWVSPSTLMQSLQLWDEASLIDVSILCGNRFTARLNKTCQLVCNLGLLDRSFEEVAEWVAKLDTDQWFSVADNLRANHPYCDAIARSFQLFGAAEDEGESCSPLQLPTGNSVVLKVERKVFDATLAAVDDNGVYWRWPVLEPMSVGLPCFSDLTLPLRKTAYSILGKEGVWEYGVMSGKSFSRELVKGGGGKGLRVSEMTSEECLVALFSLLTRPGAGDPLNTPQEEVATVVDELDKGLLPDLAGAVLACGALCFMQHLHSDSAYQLSPEQLQALVATCVFCSASAPPLIIPERPSSCFLRVAMQFTHILEQARFLASSLGVTDSLPPPSSIFYPQAFIPHSVIPLAGEEPSPNLREAYHNSQLVLNKPPVQDLLQEISLNWQQPKLSRLLKLYFQSKTCVENLKCFLFQGCRLSPPPPSLQLIFDQQLQEVIDGDHTPSEMEVGDEVTGSQCDGASDVCVSQEQTVPEGQVLLEEVEGIWRRSEEVGDDGEVGVSGGGVESVGNCMLESQVRPQSPSSCSVSECGEEPLLQLPSPIPQLSSSSSSMYSYSLSDSSPTPPPSSPQLPKKRVSLDLPISAHRTKLLEMIEENRVVCVEGETGCGKSTRVPQYILDHSLSQTPPRPCRVLVTQPRRMAAIKLAERVAQERGERLGVSVGYCVGGDRSTVSGTAITYCTTGYLLQVSPLSLFFLLSCVLNFSQLIRVCLQPLSLKALVHNPDMVSKYTHIILDEIHERSTEADFTLLVVRELLQSQGPSVKLVVMSATMQGSLLVTYLRQTFDTVGGPYFVGVKHFGVDTFFIDEIDRIPHERVRDKRQLEAAQNLAILNEHRPPEMSLSCARPILTPYTQEVCTEVIVSQAHLGESTLVFLSGYSEITRYYHYLLGTLEARGIGDHFRVFILHSQIPLEDQREAFIDPPPTVAHVILATNIAESSVTLPKLRVVINFGIYRRLKYDSKRHISCLVRNWSSRASCKQRAGRAGRVFVGTAVHLFTRRFHDQVLREYDPPEILTAPIAKLVLQAKQIGEKIGQPRPSLFLGLAVTPPLLQQLEAALDDLGRLGAVESQPGEEVEEEAEITFLGHFSLSLPVDLDLSRVVLYGVLFGCVVEAVVIAASLSMSQEVLRLPTRVVMKDERQFRESLARSYQSRCALGAETYSDAVMVCNLFKKWMNYRDCHQSSRCAAARTFSVDNACQWERLLQLEAVVSEIAGRTLRHIPTDSAVYKQVEKLSSLCRLSSSSRASSVNFSLIFCGDIDVVRAMLAAAYPDHLLYGVRRCDSLNSKEKAESQGALELMKSCEVEVSRTLVLAGGKKPSKATVHQLAEAVLPNNFFQVNSFGGSFLLTLNHTFESNPLSALLCNLNITPLPDVALRNDDKLVTSPLPPELALFWQFCERRSQWRAGDVDVTFSPPQHPLSISWFRVTEEKERVHLLCWRNPTGLVCETNLQRKPLPFLAVACHLQGFGGSQSVSGSHLTLLPSLHGSRNALLMALTFQPLSAAVSGLVDRQRNQIVGLSINSFTLPSLHPRHYLDQMDIENMNKLRGAISRVFSSRQAQLSLSDLTEIPHHLTKLLAHGRVPQRVGKEETTVREWEDLLGNKADKVAFDSESEPEEEEEKDDLPSVDTVYEYLPYFEQPVEAVGRAETTDTHSDTESESRRKFKLSPNAPEFVPSIPPIKSPAAQFGKKKRKSYHGHHPTGSPGTVPPQLPTSPLSPLSPLSDPSISHLLDPAGLSSLSQLPADQQKRLWHLLTCVNQLLPKNQSDQQQPGSLDQFGQQQASSLNQFGQQQTSSFGQQQTSSLNQFGQQQTSSLNQFGQQQASSLNQFGQQQTGSRNRSDRQRESAMNKRRQPTVYQRRRFGEMSGGGASPAAVNELGDTQNIVAASHITRSRGAPQAARSASLDTEAPSQHIAASHSPHPPDNLRGQLKTPQFPHPYISRCVSPGVIAAPTNRPPSPSIPPLLPPPHIGRKPHLLYTPSTIRPPPPIQFPGPSRIPLISQSKLDLSSRAPGAQLSSVGGGYQLRFPTQPSLPHISHTTVLRPSGMPAGLGQRSDSSYSMHSGSPTSSGAQFFPEALPQHTPPSPHFLTPAQYSAVCETLVTYMVAQLQLHGPSARFAWLLKSFLQETGLPRSLGRALVQSLPNYCKRRLTVSVEDGVAVVSLPERGRERSEVEERQNEEDPQLLSGGEYLRVAGGEREMEVEEDGNGERNPGEAARPCSSVESERKVMQSLRERFLEPHSGTEEIVTQPHSCVGDEGKFYQPRGDVQEYFIQPYSDEEKLPEVQSDNEEKFGELQSDEEKFPEVHSDDECAEIGVGEETVGLLHQEIAPVVRLIRSGDEEEGAAAGTATLQDETVVDMEDTSDDGGVPPTAGSGDMTLVDEREGEGEEKGSVGGAVSEVGGDMDTQSLPAVEGTVSNSVEEQSVIERAGETNSTSVHFTVTDDLTKAQLEFFVACLQLAGGHSHIPKLSHIYRSAHKKDVFFEVNAFMTHPDILRVGGLNCVWLVSGRDLSQLGIQLAELGTETREMVRDLIDCCTTSGRNLGGELVCSYHHNMPQNTRPRRPRKKARRERDDEKARRERDEERARREKSHTPSSGERRTRFSLRKRSYPPRFPHDVQSSKKPGNISHILKYYKKFFATRTESILYADLLQDYITSTQLPGDFYLPSELLKHHFEVYRKDQKRYICPMKKEEKEDSPSSSESRDKRETDGNEGDKKEKIKTSPRKPKSKHADSSKSKGAFAIPASSSSRSPPPQTASSQSGAKGTNKTPTEQCNTHTPTPTDPTEPGHPDHVLKFYNQLFKRLRQPIPVHGFSVRYLRAYKMPREFRIPNSFLEDNFRVYRRPERGYRSVVVPWSWGECEEGVGGSREQSAKVAPVTEDPLPETEVWGEEPVPPRMVDTTCNTATGEVEAAGEKGDEGVGGREEGVGSREEGVGSREEGVGGREEGVGGREEGDVKSEGMIEWVEVESENKESVGRKEKGEEKSEDTNSEAAVSGPVLTELAQPPEGEDSPERGPERGETPSEIKDSPERGAPPPEGEDSPGIGETPTEIEDSPERGAPPPEGKDSPGRGETPTEIEDSSERGAPPPEGEDSPDRGETPTEIEDTPERGAPPPEGEDSPDRGETPSEIKDSPERGETPSERGVQTDNQSQVVGSECTDRPQEEEEPMQV